MAKTRLQEGNLGGNLLISRARSPPHARPGVPAVYPLDIFTQPRPEVSLLHRYRPRTPFLRKGPICRPTGPFWLKFLLVLTDLWLTPVPSSVNGSHLLSIGSLQINFYPLRLFPDGSHLGSKRYSAMKIFCIAKDGGSILVTSIDSFTTLRSVCNNTREYATICPT